MKLNSGKATAYGFGWNVEARDGRLNIGHGGATSGFSASIQRYPQNALCVIMLTNTDEQIASTLAQKSRVFTFKGPAKLTRSDWFPGKSRNRRFAFFSTAPVTGIGFPVSGLKTLPRNNPEVVVKLRTNLFGPVTLLFAPIVTGFVMLCARFPCSSTRLPSIQLKIGAPGASEYKEPVTSKPGRLQTGGIYFRGRLVALSQVNSPVRSVLASSETKVSQPERRPLSGTGNEKGPGVIFRDKRFLLHFGSSPNAPVKLILPAVSTDKAPEPKPAGAAAASTAPGITSVKCLPLRERQPWSC